MNLPKVSFLIPIYNDAKHVGRTIKSLENQDYKGKIEVVFADGNSTDNSVEIIKKSMKEKRKKIDIKLYKNPARNTAVGRNICLKHSTGKYIFNYSSHAYAEKNFVSTLVKKLEKYPKNIGAVGASCNPLDNKQNFVGRCITTVFSTLLGGIAGTDQNISTGKEREASSVAFTAYRKEVFDKIGGFDEDLWCGQDGELNIRMRKAGYKLMFTPDTCTKQQKRDSLRKFWRQMFRYGMAGALRTKKHPDSFRLIYLIPALGAIGLIGALIAGAILFATGFQLLLQLLSFALILYILIGWTSALVVSKNLLITLCAPIFYFIVHFAYGVGFIRGLFSSRF
ncbi:MAG: glycosyltransferase [Nanoarchaeota archaeon]|nr:glycosyltransferase [Nanoarchaeota archaeon]